MRFIDNYVPRASKTVKTNKINIYTSLKYKNVCIYVSPRGDQGSFVFKYIRTLHYI